MTDQGTSPKLYEELLLIALNDEKGTIHYQAGMMQYALAAAIVAELILAERIEIGDEKKFVAVRHETPLGVPLLDDCFARIRDARRRARLETWLERFATRSDLRHDIARELCRRGILKEQEGRILWIFKQRRYPQRDGRVERGIIDRLHNAITGKTQRPRVRTTLLLSLAHGTGLLSIPFDKKLLKQNKSRIEALIEGERLGRAARDVLQAAQTAIAVAASTAATAAVISSS